MQPIPKRWDNRPQFEHLPPKSELPTMYDLPSENPEEPGVPDDFHVLQPRLLSETCQPDPTLVSQFYTAADINLYYDPANVSRYKRPDWFLALGVAQAPDVTQLRLSYVIWQEEIAPYLLVELLSPGTEQDDLGSRVRNIHQPPAKWEVYEQYLQVPYYVVFSRYTHELRCFGLVAGRYRQLGSDDQESVPEQPGLWLPEAGLGLGVWSGTYTGVRGKWLRFFDAAGQWLPCQAERLVLETQRAEQEAQRAERLAEQLRALGVDPDTL